ncbi:MAG TPA: Fmu (Sun) domain-containing protein [Chitinophagaceae bacterium]|nr:Fmu (Sun) domain-containing protein [Chitinophagaceae bacterium]
MSRFHSYLNSVVSILHQYDGRQPLAIFLKQFFAANRKYGSKDRKLILHLCYCYFRLGKALPAITAGERALLGLYLCSMETNELLATLKAQYNDSVNLPLAGKLELIQKGNFIEDVFPWAGELSASIDHSKLCRSFFVRPDLFLRIRPGKKEYVSQKLSATGIEFRERGENCLALSNTPGLEELFEMNRDIVVQDYNSQRVGEFIRIGLAGKSGPGTFRVWDCCAASGGKSIMAFDLDPAINLTVSDIRESILANLKKRFAEAGIRKYKAFPIDLSIPISTLTTHDSQLTIPDSPFDLIICDVPCTGSGTWSRTPEQLYYFEKNTIGEYVRLQRKIISNTIPQLQKDGFFLYITCSVFKKENEEQVDFICEKFGLEIKRMEVLEGYEMKADTLFAALLVKPY